MPKICERLYIKNKKKIERKIIQTDGGVEKKNNKINTPVRT